MNEGRGTGNEPDQAVASSVVVEYDPRWESDFAVLHAFLAELLAGLPYRIEHVGSTAVPGLAAKPIIDLDIVVPAEHGVAGVTRMLAMAGFEPEGDLGVAGRSAFRPAPSLPYHHLYVVVEGSRALRDHLDFRDLLRRDPLARAEYARVKFELAGLLRDDRRAYTEGKGRVIERLLRRSQEPR
ncbi:GrpB family protein [Lysobacter korlensis]|uniref:GrpB family protein n=1 Tax=Lysobacter korlensis TaxID=553636 RepID=A0ABV6RND7_9GAMM